MRHREKDFLVEKLKDSEMQLKSYYHFSFLFLSRIPTDFDCEFGESVTILEHTQKVR